MSARSASRPRGSLGEVLFAALSLAVACSSAGGATGTAATGGSGSSSGGAPASGGSGEDTGGLGSGGATGGALSSSGGTGSGAIGDASTDGAGGRATASGGDAASSAGGAASCTARSETSINDDRSGAGGFEYEGPWATASGAGKFDGDDHFSTGVASVTVRFEGNRVAVHAARAPHHGIAQVSVDGAPPVDVDLYAATRVDDVPVFRSPALGTGPHTLRVATTERKNPASDGTVITIDRVVIERGDCGGEDPDGGVDGGARDGILTRRGKTLYFNGAPYESVGINAPGMTGCTRTGAPFTDEQMDAFFKALKPHSLTRAWAFETQGMEGIDRMVHFAELNSQLLILTFADGRSYCGETDGRRGGDGSGKVSSWYVTGYKARYLPWVSRVVGRFKDSKAVGMWELLNEPGDTDDRTVRAFFDDVAGRIKAEDPRHLICSGSQAEYVDGTRDYAYVHGGPNIDVASLHEYDYDYQNSHTIISGHLAPTLNAMRSIDKPLIVGEVGINAKDGTCLSRAERRDAFRQKFDGYLGQDGVGAVLVWSYRPAPQGEGCDSAVFPDDPLMDLLRTYP